METRPFLDFSSGYVQRAVDFMPKQGTKSPWRLYQNYLLDLLTLRYWRIDDGTLKFTRRKASGRHGLSTCVAIGAFVPECPCPPCSSP